MAVSKAATVTVSVVVVAAIAAEPSGRVVAEEQNAYAAVETPTASLLTNPLVLCGLKGPPLPEQLKKLLVLLLLRTRLPLLQLRKLLPLPLLTKQLVPQLLRKQLPLWLISRLSLLQQL